MSAPGPHSPPDLETVLRQVKRPKRAVITAGMPYANGPIHLGHLAGAQVPPDIFARYLRMLIGKENVLFVCGTDDHGSTSEVAAIQAGIPVRQFIDELHARQQRTFDRYHVSFDVYTGTSRPETFPIHRELSQGILRQLSANGMLAPKTTRQWYDPKVGRFLQDRYVRGQCPNPKCENQQAYSDDCEVCGTQYDPSQLIHPRSAISDATPELRDTVHWWLDMWQVDDELCDWIRTKEGKWRMPVYNEVINTILPGLRFDNIHEAKYKELKAALPKHKSKYAAGKKVAAQFDSKAELLQGQAMLNENGIPTELLDGWAHRAITRDVTWGIPLPKEFGPEAEGKTLYVWPDSLIAPIAFSQVALKARGEDPARYAEFWRDPEAKIYQFLGQDNVFFYTIMQGALWLGSQKDPHHQPEKGDLQLTEVFGVFHLQINGEKMSKSTGNYFTGDQLLDEKGYSADQLRYFLALLSLPEKSSNFDLAVLDERNRFLAGPLNAAFEKPISAVHSRFGGRVPEGKLLEKAVTETTRIVQRYLKAMEKAEYANLLFAIENYARLINSFFTQFKPHDDRFPEEARRDALYSCFYVLKNMMIMLHPFVPETMDKLRQSLQLPQDVFRIDELGKPIPAGHEIGQKQQFFPTVAGAAETDDAPEA